MQFVQENRVTVSECSSDSISLQDITSQSDGIKPLRIYEEEPKLSTAVIKEFENDEVDHTNGSKVDVCDNDHDGAHLSLADHDEMGGMPTTAELNRGSVQPKHEVELKADAVVDVMDTRETSMKSCVFCCDYASIVPFERTNASGQFREDKPAVYERVIVKLACTNKGLSSFKLLFECYYLLCKLLCAYARLTRYVVCLLVIYILRYNDTGMLPLRFEDIDDRRKSANELFDDFPT
ncbi:unnamed protein product [Trichobilharzia regenti]|nr:unnamed protein product [Trichobilharzia regenti]